MAARRYVTERYDDAAARWFVERATATDLRWGAQELLHASLPYVRAQGWTDATFNAEACLQGLKRQVAAWVERKGKVAYRYRGALDSVAGGRLYADSGYATWPPFVRALLGARFYWHLRMADSLPATLLTLCDAYGVAAPTLTDYVTRDNVRWMENLEYSTERDLAQEVEACLFGETYEPMDPTFVCLRAEAEALRDVLWAEPSNKPVREAVSVAHALRLHALGARAEGERDKDLRWTTLRIITESLERKMGQEVEARLHVAHGLTVHTIMHDAWLVAQTDEEMMDLDAIRKDLDTFILGKYKAQWAFSWDPMVNRIVMPAEAPPAPVAAAPAAGKKRGRGRPRTKARQENVEADEANEEEKGPVPGVTWDEYKVMKQAFEEDHFYYVPTNAFVEITPAGLRYYELKHAKEYMDIKWSFGGWDNFMLRISFLDIWRNDPTRRCIKRVDFTPTDDPEVYYMPVVFEYEKHQDEEVTYEEEQDILEIFGTLVSAVVNDDKTLGDYLLSYFAHMIQKPLEQPGVSIILVGAKGVGKDTLLDFLRLHIVGPAFSHNYTETRQFFDKHDVDRKDKFMLKMEDSDSALCKTHAKDLRARITAREGSVNPKGRDPVTFPNYARYFFTANQAIPVGINDDNDRERRFIILAVSSNLKGNTTFWTRCYQRLFSDKGAKVIGNLLAGRDLRDFQVRVQPENEYQEGLYEVERTPEQRFIEDGWTRGVEWSSGAAFKNYQTFCSENGFPKWTETAIGFGQKLAYFVMQKKLVKRIGKARVAYYKKISGTAEEEEEAEAAVASGAGVYISPEGALAKAERERRDAETSSGASTVTVLTGGFSAGTRTVVG